jgi:glucose/arabinose dehydrogenase
MKIRRLLPILVTAALGLYACNKKENDEEPPAPGTTTEPATRSLKTALVLDGLAYPWGMAFLPGGDLLFTERGGKFSVLEKNASVPALLTTRQVQQNSEGGLLGVAVDPDFAENQFVYAYETATDNRVVRYKLSGLTLAEDKIIVQGIPKAGNHNGGVIQFGPDGFLYIGTGDAQNGAQAQQLSSLSGKILRVDRDGNPAQGNPFNTMVWSYGHRNVQGITWAEDGTMFAMEHGPSGEMGWCCHDEFNRIEKGKNYGWPLALAGTEKDSLTPPLDQSGDDTWAPSGCVFTGQDHFWPNYVVGACLRGEKMVRFRISADRRSVAGRADTLQGTFRRIRNIVKGPGGALYFCTSNGDDQIYRLSP